MKAFLGFWWCTVALGIAFLPDVVFSNEDCVHLLSGESGEFKSPNYPNHYPSNATCTWLITVPEGDTVSLKFQSFEVSYKIT